MTSDQLPGTVQPLHEPAPQATVVRSRRASKRTQRRSSRTTIVLTQVAVIVGFLLAWQYVPQVGSFSQWRLLDPFFISSPSQVWESLVNLVFARDGVPGVWEYLRPTLIASVVGLVIAMVVGGAIGLLLGSFEFIGSVFRPMIIAINAVPRVALIPIVVVIFGTGTQSSVVIAFMVVVFVALFNAYEGARTVEAHVRHNVGLLGATGWDVMWRVRFPYALAWTLSSLPIAVSFAIISVVTGEILTGSSGMGLLITTATNAANTSMVFAVIIVLSVVALLLLWVAERFKRRVLHWWIPSE